MVPMGAKISYITYTYILFIYTYMCVYSFKIDEMTETKQQP